MFWVSLAGEPADALDAAFPATPSEAILVCSGGDGDCRAGLGVLDTLVRSGDLVPDRPALRLCTLHDQFAASTYGIVFRATVRPDCGENSDSGQEGVFRLAFDGEVETMALTGESAALGGTGSVYRSFVGTLSIETMGIAVFGARIDVGTTLAHQTMEAVFTCRPDNCPASPASAIVRRGRRLPGGFRIRRIVTALVRDGGDILVATRISNRADDRGRQLPRQTANGSRAQRRTYRQALYLRRAASGLRRILVEGDPIAEDSRTILAAMGLPVLSPAGRVAFRARVQDASGTTGDGIFLIELPPADAGNATSAAVAAVGGCGDFNQDGNIAATDALGALKTAVGSATCLPCVCDTDQSGTTTATDALRTLQAAVGISVTLDCKPDQNPYSWDGGGDGVSWHDPLNWTDDRLPDGCDAVTINAGGTMTVVHDNQGDGAAYSVDTTESFGLTGGTLTLRAGMNVAGTFRIVGGTLAGATVPTGSGGPAGVLFTSSGGSLDSVTMDSDMDLTASNSSVRILNGLDLNGTASMGSGAMIDFRGTGENPLTGTGDVVFVSGTGYLLVRSGSTLRIASTMTIHGGAGQIGSTSGGLINQGTIDSDASGRIIVTGSNWDNQGTLRASGGELRLSGTWTNNATIDARAGVFVTAPNGFTQGSGGTLTVEIVGAGSNGLVTVTGQASLGGTLNIDRTGGFIPTVGSTFTVMTYGSSSGGFATATGTDIGNGTQFTPTVGVASLVLDVTP